MSAVVVSGKVVKDMRSFTTQNEALYGGVNQYINPVGDKFMVFAEEQKPYVDEDGVSRSAFRFIAVTPTSGKCAVEQLSEYNFGHAHELVLPGAQRMKYDLDCDRSKYPDITLDELYEIIKYLIDTTYFEVTQKNAPVDLSDKVSVFSSCDETKFSFHILFREWWFNHHTQCRELCRRVTESLDGWDGIIDKGVYRSMQQFRMVGSTKFGKNRVKALMETWPWDNTYSYRPHFTTPKKGIRHWSEIYERAKINPSDPKNHHKIRYIELLDSLVQYRQEHKYRDMDCVCIGGFYPPVKERVKLNIPEEYVMQVNEMFDKSEFAEYHSLGSVSGNIISAKRRQLGFCSICGREHSNDGGFIAMSPSKKGGAINVIFYCHRGVADKLPGKKLGVIVDQTVEVPSSEPEDIPEEHEQMCSWVEKSDMTDVDLASIWWMIEGLSDTVRVVNPKEVWTFNPNKMLWLQSDPKIISGKIIKEVVPYLENLRKYWDDYINIMELLTGDEKTDNKIKGKLNEVIKRYKTVMCVNRMVSVIVNDETRMDSEFLLRLNSHRHLLPVKGGKVVDLKTGKVGKRTPDHYFTYEVAVEYDPSAECPQFIKACEQAFCGDKSIMDFDRQWHGYCLTGEINLQQFVIMYGSGSNFKSTRLDLFKMLTGGQTVKAVPNQLVLNNGNRFEERFVNSNMSQFPRLTVHDEVSANREHPPRLNEANIKSISTAHTVISERKGLHPAEVTNYSKLAVICNNPPETSADPSMVRRAVYFQHKAKFVDDEDKVDESRHIYLKNHNLFEELKDELSGILNYYIRGAMEYYKAGKKIVIPKQFETYKNEEMKQGDPLFVFLTEVCYVVGNGKTKNTSKQDMFKSFRTWCNDNSMKCEFKNHVDMGSAVKTMFAAGFDLYSFDNDADALIALGSESISKELEEYVERIKSKKERVYITGSEKVHGGRVAFPFKTIIHGE